MTIKIETLVVLFVEDHVATQKAIDGYMKEYAFTREYAFTYKEFLDKFSKIKPHAVVLDYDLNDGSYLEEVYAAVEEAKKNENRYIGLIGVTAQDPFDKIKKIMKSVGYKDMYYNDGQEKFYLDLVANFNKIQKKLENE